VKHFLVAASIGIVFSGCSTTAHLSSPLEANRKVGGSSATVNMRSGATFDGVQYVFGQDSTFVFPQDSSQLLDSTQNVQVQIGPGRVALANRNWDKALDHAKQAMKIDTANVPSHYIAAVAEREMGAGLLSRNTRWQSSRRNFEWVVRHDSSFEDVLYQYALLERYDNNQNHALELARAQIESKPDLVGPQLGLYKLYRYWMSVQDSAEFMGWVRNQQGDLPEFFIAESYRRSGNFASAESLLTDLMSRQVSVSPQAIRLALSRLRFKKGDRAGAEAEYWRAVHGLQSELGAAILFEDLKYIVSDAELDTYQGLSKTKSKQEFIRNFWNFRNPSLALKTNLRLQEHIRRCLVAEERYEYYGFRTRFNNPDWLHELTFPRAFSLNNEFNDMGLIYLRHGEPDDILRVSPNVFEIIEDLQNPIKELNPRIPWMRPPAPTRSEGKPWLDIKNEIDARQAEGLQPMSGQLDPSESWLYNATGDSPKLIFYFQKHNSAGNNWRLTPSPASEYMMNELLEWDVKYQRFFTERELTRTIVQDQVKAAEKVDVDYALSTEKQTWEKTTDAFRFPHSIDVFRAPDGKALLDISYAIPLAPLARHLSDTVQSLPVEIGVSLIDSHSQKTDSQLDTVLLGLSHTRTGVVVDLARYTVPPDSYSVSMHIRPLQGNTLGTWHQALRVNDYSRPGLMVSSIQILRPSTEKGSVIIDGVKVTQSPFRTHVRTDSLYLYFQIYHLVPDAFGSTAYRTECLLLPKDESDLSKGDVIHRVEKTGKDEMAAEFYAIDVRSVNPGRYRLIVKITDRKRVQTLMAERDIEIVKP
jgi:hypothetical protein